MKLSFKEKFGYSLGELASSGLWQTLMFFLPAFYTDVYLLPAAATATLFLIVRVFDAMNDPIMGTISDRTNTRWGKFRPFLMLGALPLVFTAVMMFTVPDLNPTGKLIYAYATYFSFLIFYTMVTVPFNALIGVMSPDPEQRTALSSFKFVFAYGASLLVQGGLIPLVEKLGEGDQAKGYPLAIAGLGVLCLAGLLFAFLTTKERVQPMKQSANSIKEDFKDLSSNRPWLLLFFSSITLLIYIGIRSSAVMYYFQYFVGRKDLASLFMVVGTIAVLAGVVPTNWMAKKIGKAKLFMICLGVISASLVFNYFLGPDQIVLIFATQIVFSLASGPTMPLLWSMLADSSDYSEWKNGRRATGLAYSAATFAQKTGVAIGASGTLALLSWYGYEPNVEQGADALMGIKNAMTIYPALIAFGSIGCFMFYNLSDQKLEQIKQELQSIKDNDKSEAKSLVDAE
ncbi:MFS transporter [Persicobacter diffluens]|uniref:MFS transporter n=1 Tax=Persicobacter diffluens TaxID=981 RepID=A0AAN5ALS8_9BACT|nr:MFS transporter [Persicobacter diffluens]